MKSLSVFWRCLPVAAFAWPCLLMAGNDAPAWLHPYEGSTLRQSQVEAFNEYLRVVGVVAPGHDAVPQGVERLEGKVTRLRYDNPKGRSTLEIARNYRQALEARGLKVDHECARSQACGNHRKPSWMSLNGINLGAGGDIRYFTGRLALEGRPVYVSVAINPHVTYLHIVEPTEMDTGMVQIDEAAFASELETHGRVELPGIYFDSGTARLQAASDPALDVAAGVLRQHAALKLDVVGHTDNQGGETFNLDLSRQRAAAVVQALVSRGVEADRLGARGMGLAQPVADNATEEGRARNRRVELVRR